MVMRAVLLWTACAAWAAAPESQYAGSKTCFGCHSEISRSYSQTSMGRSLRNANELDGLNLPDQATIPLGDSGRVVRVTRDERVWRQAEEQPNVFVDHHKLDYAVGSGTNGLTFIVRRGNSLFQAPLSYYSRPAKWDLSPGYEHGDLAFGRPIAEECIQCHSGRPQPVANRPGEYLDPPLNELAIGCENCHGPGALHAANPKRTGVIVNPAKLNPRLAENICISCHQGGDARALQPAKSIGDFRPGQWLIDTVAIFKVPPKPDDVESDLLEHDSAMKISRCFQASAGRLSCLTCHNPHVQPSSIEAVSYFRAKCFTCHTDDSCSVPKAARQNQNPADNCIGCHMPKRNIALISHSALTNHRIPARANEALPKHPVAEQNDLLLLNPRPGATNAVPDLTRFRAYIQLLANHPEYQQRYLDLLDSLSKTQPSEPLVQAALGHKLISEQKYEEALGHLTSAASLRDVNVWQDTATALSSLNRDEDALACLKQASGDNPFNDVLLKMLVLQYIKLKRYTDAQQTMQRYVELFPEDSFMRGLLARVSH